MVTMRININSSLFLYGASGLSTGFVFVALYFSLPRYNFFYSFLFNGWAVQFLSSWLFLLGIFYWIQRFLFFKKEEDAFQSIRMPEFTIRREQASELIITMPELYKKTVTMRRIRELLQAFSYGEDIIRLNEELSRRDMSEVDRGHLILDSLRSLIPVIGFLGTVIGLSMGMVKFPEVTDLDLVRSALKGLAVSLGVAFNTTLLALCYTIVIILLTSFLKQREGTLIENLDERARLLIGKMKAEIVPNTVPKERGMDQLPSILNNVLSPWKEEFLIGIKELFENLSSQNTKTAIQIEEILRGAAEEAGRILANNFEEIKMRVQNPPNYQIIVKHLDENRNETQG